ncbi:hypothetical protein BSLA_01f0594 [Burkholderia stabilis]|nr:hypothetical protein BSLA_01f0594 [Burkholderia stabilis]
MALRDAGGGARAAAAGWSARVRDEPRPGDRRARSVRRAMLVAWGDFTPASAIPS